MACENNKDTILKSLIKESKYFDANDNLLRAILQWGLEGLDKYEEEMGKKNFDKLKSSVSKLLNTQNSCMIDDKNKITSLKALIKESKYFDADDNLLNAILQKGLEGLAEFKYDVGKKYFDNLKSSVKKLLYTENNNTTDDKKKSTLKALIKESKYIDADNSLLNALLKTGLEGLDKFREDMGKKSFDSLKSSVSKILGTQNNCKFC
ncbi:uncharacterized protein LOC105849052 [Hydra vulgaris]|uniref:uncharacterized protein LOC105849052 n=1 Tax=Hydra vulgaris TaxID=6087 RepID=UPI0032E9EC5D